jgi:hypothetical protein
MRRQRKDCLSWTLRISWSERSENDDFFFEKKLENQRPMISQLLLECDFDHF